MNIHEYQAKLLLRRYGVAVLDGGVAYTPVEAGMVAQDIGGPTWVIKSQIHAGGRGKGSFKGTEEGAGGGVRIVRSIADVERHAEDMLNEILVTHQTGPEGREVKRLYIEQGCEIDREFYFSLLIDRSTARITFMVSTEGGVEIEKIAAETPEKILKLPIDTASGYQQYQGRQFASELGLEDKQIEAVARFMGGMYKAFIELDCSIIEINPTVLTKAGELVALDAKMSFDENALYRHKDIEQLRDEDEEDPVELEAARHGLNYVRLPGTIGCMVNGAGLAMATMDLIKLYGGEPANFLDVGGGATKERVTTAFKLILSDPNVDGILVNIFGGIMRCDVIAEGIVAAARDVSLNVPLIVRLEGTNVELGKKILKQSGLPIVSADNLADAAQKVVTATKEAF